MIYDEETLRKWEADPVRYREEIDRYEQELRAERDRTIEAGIRCHRNTRLGTPEYDAEVEVNTRLDRLMTRVSEMQIAIIRFDCEQIERQRAARRPKKACSFLPADDSKWELWLSYHPAIGMA